MIREILFGTIFLLSGFANASNETIVDFDHVILTSSANRIEVTISEVNSKPIKVKVKVGDKNIIIEPGFLFGAENVLTETIRIIAEPSNPGQIPHGELIKHGFMVSFEFGGAYFHGNKAKDESIEVGKVLRLYFSSAGFLRSELAEPKGDYSNEWHFFLKEPGGVVEENGIEKSIKCPWTESIRSRKDQ
ncbi:MAG: hypothetical protein L3J39_11770 [Verrucomicrobiales bacterium]|nr:hypothetical protein [Verrucomicrobiales bacterium]